MKLVRGAVVVLVGLLALTGCATSPSTAAVVGDTTITTSQAEQLASDLTPYLSSTGTTAQAVNFEVAIEASRQIAAAQGLTFTDAQKTSAQTSLGIPDAMAADATLTGFVDGYLTYALTWTTLGQDAFLQQADQLDITVNPRFGSWSEEDFSVVAGGGSLSSPASSSDA